MSDRPIWQWTAVETAAAIKNHAATSQQVTAAHVKRMREANPGVNAVVLDMGDEAMEQARACDSAGQRWCCARPAARRTGDRETKYRLCWQTQSQRGAGAQRCDRSSRRAGNIQSAKGWRSIFLVRPIRPEFSMRGFTDNPLHGLTLNPWERRHHLWRLVRRCRFSGSTWHRHHRPRQRHWRIA